MTQFKSKKDFFELPEGIIYLDGNSLGPVPKGALAAAEHTIRDEWGTQLIKAWNTAGWMDLPRQVGNKIAPLIGAAPGTLAMGDTLSIKVFQALDAALKLRPDRKVIVSDIENFPSDLYMAKGLVDLLKQGYELKTPDPSDVAGTLDETVAAVLLTHVNYRTGEMYDMDQMTKLAHEHGAVMIWDLAHSAGAIDVDVTASQAEFAVGCTYKYLNGGPGAPAFIYVRPDIALKVDPTLAGWLGHDEPFAMDPKYTPAQSTERFRIGTPSILQFAVLDHALDVWNDVNMSALRAESMRLTDLFVCEVERTCPAITLESPRDASIRGSQVSFGFEHGYAAMQAVIAAGVIGDFRMPNIMRFGVTPLFVDETDIQNAAHTIARVINEGVWKDPKYHERSRVT